MTSGAASASPPRLSAVPDVPVARPDADPRVRAAAAVLAGQPVVDVAAEAGVDVPQVLRWAHALATGGAAAVGGVGVDRSAAGPAGSAVSADDFLSVVAHELRTPLTAARAALRVLAGDIPPALRERVSATVLDRLGDLDRLTLDVLDAVGVVSGRAVLDPQRVRLDAVVDAACAAAGVPHTPGAAVHVHVDPARLQTVVATLLKHAERYAAPDRVSAAVATLADGALLTVRLDGVSADPDAARALFEPFGAAARSDGNGLALYVVRALAVASGGAVGIAGTDGEPDSGSAEPGSPATVLWVRLPLHAPSPEAGPAARRPSAVPPPRRSTS